MASARPRAHRPARWRTRSGGGLSVWCRAWVLPPNESSSGKPRHHARRIVAKLVEIEPGDRAIGDDDAAADEKIAQMGGTAGGDRAEQRIVQAEITRMRQLEDGEIGELARRDDAGVVEAENARAVAAPPTHDLLDAHDGGALDR